VGNERAKLFFLESFGIPIGQIRFDKDDDGYWEIDYSVDSKFRGMGFGSVLVEKGLYCLKKVEYGVKLKAQVKAENIASIRVFRKIKFHEIAIGDAFLFTMN
jgi:spore coat polysaccharide biosynthesis protein SpsF